MFYQDVKTTKSIRFEVNSKLIIFQNLQPIAVITKIHAFVYTKINIIFVCFKKGYLDVDLRTGTRSFDLLINLTVPEYLGQATFIVYEPIAFA